MEVEDIIGEPVFVSLFKQTPRISTYLFALFAGPYTEFWYKGEGLQKRVFCRDSKKEDCNAEEMFKITSSTINYYENMFQTPYPFDKIDYVYVPEFRIGAMENVGAITVNESFIPGDDKITELRRRYRAFIVAHELAHMWFGDLVTIKWWNETWLKESFADFASSTLMKENAEMAQDYPEGEYF